MFRLNFRCLTLYCSAFAKVEFVNHISTVFRRYLYLSDFAKLQQINAMFNVFLLDYSNLSHYSYSRLELSTVTLCLSHLFIARLALSKPVFKMFSC